MPARSPNPTRRHKHAVTREPREHIVVDFLKHRGVVETVYFCRGGRSKLTRDINKATRLTQGRAEEVRRNWGGLVKHNP